MSSVPDPAVTPWLPLWDTGTVSGGGAGSIPGEVKLWTGKTLPAAKYGKWVWADGAVYDEATYPEAAANIAAEWKTAHGAADPGAGKFRAPDLRGLAPAGMDAMPGGADAGRIARATPIAGKAGEETHALTLAELANHAHAGATAGRNVAHTHGGNTGYEAVNHRHPVGGGGGGTINQGASGGNYDGFWPGYWSGYVDANHYHAFTSGTESADHTHAITAEGGGGAHENLQPTVWVPYIVRLDG